jgi:hypothetical protein
VRQGGAETRRFGNAEKEEEAEGRSKGVHGFRRFKDYTDKRRDGERERQRVFQRTTGSQRSSFFRGAELQADAHASASSCSSALLIEGWMMGSDPTTLLILILFLTSLF